MSLETAVMDASSRQAFRRGEDLVASRAVSTWQAEARDGSVLLTGTVSDRASVVGGVEVVLDADAGRILSHGCPCTPRRGEDGLCKHCVALALTYLDARRRFGGRAVDSRAVAALEEAPGGAPDAISLLKTQTQELLAQFRAQDARAGARRAGRSGAIPEPQTSPQVGHMVYAYAEERARAVARGGAAGQPSSPHAGTAGPVDLHPTLAAVSKSPSAAGSLERCTWELRLRIADGRAGYAVRRIDELVAAWEAEACNSYGRDLSFAHTRDAFTERARGILGIVARVLRTQEAARAAGRTSPSAAYGVNTKSLPLSDEDAADLLDALRGGEVLFESRSAADEARPRRLLVVDGDPAPEIRVRAGERGGYDVELPRGADCVLTADRMYLLLEDRAWRCSEGYRERMGRFFRSALPAPLPLHVRAADMPAFCSSVLPALRPAAAVDLPDDVAGLLPPPARLSFRIGRARGLVTCDASVAYGGVEVGLFDPVLPAHPLRDLVAERYAQSVVHAFFPRCAPAGPKGSPLLPWDAGRAPAGKPCFEEGDVEALYRLVSAGLGELAALGDVLVPDEIRSVGVRGTPRIRVFGSVVDGLLDITVDSSDLSTADLLSYLDSYERRQRFVRLADGDIVRLEDGGIEALSELAGALGIEARALVEGVGGLPLNRVPFVDATMKRSEGVRFDRDEGFRSIVREFDSIGDNDFVEPPSLRDTLRPYQREGFKWICALAKLGIGGILADDMGLGKTLQIIAYLLSRHEAGERLPSLVVCPASLVYNWTSELARFAPALSAVAVAGTREERRRTVREAGSHDVLVTSYDLLKRDIDLYERQRFHCQVLDEAQYIKNNATLAARSAKRIRADVRFALTGTPIENRLSELWSIFDFLTPGLLGTREAFRRRFEAPVAAGDEEAARRLGSLVGPFILRRMKADVLKDLPEKTESLVYAHLEGEQEKLYRATAERLALTLACQLPREFDENRIAVLAELTKLRQICCDPRLAFEGYRGASAKLETCLDLVRSAVDGGHKVLLFSQFTSMLDIVARRLDEIGIAHHELTGDTPKERRAHLVGSFATDGVPVFLVSLKAGGVGLNLTAADIVIHYDPWWNLAAQNQATDRAHRIGQTKPVTVMRLIAQGTVEEKIVHLQEAKRDLAETVLGGEAVGSTRLTREDILALLEP